MIDLRNKLYSDIAKVLAERGALSAKEVTSFLSVKSVKVSYAYVHKCLKVLEKQNLVVGKKGKYGLNIEYLKAWRDFLTKASNTYHLDQNVFVESVTGSLLKLFKKEEAEEITRNMIKDLNKKIIGKLDSWYCGYYDPEQLELKTILSETNFKGKRVLEVGCGTGRITKDLAKVAKEIVAVDHNADAIEYDREKFSKLKNVQFEVADFEKLKTFKKESFDIIVSGWIGLHHSEQLNKIIPVLHNLLKKEGKLLILEAYPDSEYVHVLNLLKPKEFSVKEGQDRLRAELRKSFKEFKERIVNPRYIFPNYETLEEKFKIELTYEEGYEWKDEDSKKMKEYVTDKKKGDLTIGEAFLFFSCSKIN